jgi:hypothetical protein
VSEGHGRGHDEYQVVGTSLGPRSGKVTKVAAVVDSEPGHAALALILDLRMDHMWGAKKSTLPRLCALCVDGGVEIVARVSFPTVSSAKGTREEEGKGRSGSLDGLYLSVVYRLNGLVRVSGRRHSHIANAPVQASSERRRSCILQCSTLKLLGTLKASSSWHPLRPSSQHAPLPEQRVHAAR